MLGQLPTWVSSLPWLPEVVKSRYLGLESLRELCRWPVPLFHKACDQRHYTFSVFIVFHHCSDKIPNKSHFMRESFVLAHSL